MIGEINLHVSISKQVRTLFSLSNLFRLTLQLLIYATLARLAALIAA